MENPPAMSDNGILAHYSALPSQEGAGVQTTLDISDPKHQLILSQAISGESTSLWDVSAETVIRVVHLAAHYSEWDDEKTGEVIRGPMLTLIGPDGVFHTASEYAFRDLQLIASLRGRPPWSPPIAITPVQAPTRNKKTRQAIVLAE